MEAGLRVHQGGRGEPALLLLHGLGATSDVQQGWRPLLARSWMPDCGSSTSDGAWPWIRVRLLWGA